MLSQKILEGIVEMNKSRNELHKIFLANTDLQYIFNTYLIMIVLYVKQIFKI